MIYLAMDFETTGLDASRHQALSFCGILDYLGNKAPVKELPRINCFFKWPEVTVQRVAGRMNIELLKKLFLQEPETLPSDFKNLLRKFLNDNGVTGRITGAGKNPHFDLGFAVTLGADFFYRRMLDPAIFYLDPSDSVIPDLKTCLIRANIDASRIHDAEFDAEAIIHLIRRHYA